jgi:hypothetical protein
MDNLPANLFVSFLEEEIKVLRCIQPPATDISLYIKKHGIPSYKFRDDIKTYITNTIGSYGPNHISRNPYGLMIPTMYDIVLLEINFSRKMIETYTNDPLIVINQNNRFAYFAENSHYAIVELLVDFFKDYIGFIDCNKLDNRLLTSIFSRGAAPLTTLFFDKCKEMLPYLSDIIFENENEHMVDFFIDQANLSGDWSKLFVNKNPRITKMMIDFWHENKGSRSVLAKYLCSRPDAEAIALATTMPFDDIIEICINSHVDAVSYVLKNIQMIMNNQKSYPYIIRNSNPEIVDYLIDNIEAFVEKAEASLNTNPKMISFLLDHPSLIDINLLLQNKSIIEREII